ncbi:MAG: prenyltransferase/squalene oxidase repeat-containing protein [Pseudobacter sp.]|uniref:prenyltransferase/squalene oxidase repeat-containing protein n=1 Tax=Pseudobacter sp. TaxID=2045420 RepID=UPI003F7F8CD7
MQNLIHVNLQSLTDSTQAAELFLIRQQHPDGCWRDYLLEPGASEAWTTSVVLWSLACVRLASIPAPAVSAALNALYALQKPAGWGYNRHTASDADTTAWTCRVMAALQVQQQEPLSAILQRFILPDGSGQTFIGKERFGSWADHHADVQPMIGNSLVRLYANSRDPALAALIRKLREYSIISFKEDCWSSFWWATDAYAIACNLEFLRASGGIPASIMSTALHWLDEAMPPRSAFEAAQYLMIALLTGSPAEPYMNYLLNTQLDDGSWISSDMLLVPPQSGNGPVDFIPAFPDIRRLMSTAMALTSLKMVLSTTRQLMN